MALHTSLRPIDLARSTGISVQQVRNYESWGLLPPASRSKSGYRLYTQHHLAALKTARSLIGGYGRPRTGAIMQALHQGDLSAALALIDTRHSELACKRHQMEQRSPRCMHWPHNLLLCRVLTLPKRCGWERQPGKSVCAFRFCTSGNSRACCTRYATRVAATSSMTSTR